MTDGQGNTINFKNTVIIATSNAGFGNEALTGQEDKDMKIMDRIAPYFRPEFLNRFNGIIEFSHLTKDDLNEIVDLMLAEVSKTITKKGIDLVVSDDAKQHAIGYVEYAYAKQNNLAYTKLISADGKPVSPTEENFANAAKGADWSKTFAQDLTNQKGEDAWPITSTTFILIHKDQKKPEQGTEVLKFFDWAYKTGAKQANDLDYASLPDSVVEQVRAAWKTNIKDSSGKPLY